MTRDNIINKFKYKLVVLHYSVLFVPKRSTVNILTDNPPLLSFSVGSF